MMHEDQSNGDEYGFGAAASAGLRMFDGACRATGRTSRLIERVTDEDQIVCPTSQIAEHVRRLLHHAKKKTRVIVSPVNEVPMHHAGTAPHGRTYFEHTWVQAHFERALSGAAADLRTFSIAMSKTWPDAPDSKTPEQMRAEWMGQY